MIVSGSTECGSVDPYVIFHKAVRMRFYLSSYRVGNHGNHLKEMVGDGKLAYIPNALDAWSREDTKNKETRARNVDDLQGIGVSFEEVDLQNFFSKPSELKNHLARFSGVWVTGGNTFVLRQAMRLSGFDQIIHDLKSTSFLYGGYSAGVCVLAPDFSPLEIVDDPTALPYPGIKNPIWEGLGVLDFMILPHYDSDHPESADIDKEVAFCKEKGIQFRTLRDGEALFGENIEVLNRGIKQSP